MSHRILELLLVFILSSCLHLSDNKNQIVKLQIAHDGMNNCILFIKSAGATVGDSYQISILPYQEKLMNSNTGNIFIADDPGGGIPSDTSRVNFEWLSFDTVKVSFDKRLRVFKMATKSKGATIVYDSLSLTK